MPRRLAPVELVAIVRQLSEKQKTEAQQAFNRKIEEARPPGVRPALWENGLRFRISTVGCGDDHAQPAVVFQSSGLASLVHLAAARIIIIINGGKSLI